MITRSRAHSETKALRPDGRPRIGRLGPATHQATRVPVSNVKYPRRLQDLPTECLFIIMDHVLLLQNPMGVVRTWNRPLTSIFRVSSDLRHMAFDRLLHNFTFMFDSPKSTDMFNDFIFGSPETNYFNHHTFGGKHAREHIRSFAFPFCRHIVKRRSPWDILELVQCYPNVTHVAIAVRSHETTKLPASFYDDDPFEQYDVDTVMDIIDIGPLLELRKLKELVINYAVEEEVIDHDDDHKELDLRSLILVRDLHQRIRQLLRNWQSDLPREEQRVVQLPVNLISDTVYGWSRVIDDGEDWTDIVTGPEIPDEVSIPCAGYIGC